MRPGLHEKLVELQKYRDVANLFDFVFKPGTHLVKEDKKGMVLPYTLEWEFGLYLLSDWLNSPPTHNVCEHLLCVCVS